MKVRDYYDWIVIGEHPAALLSASLVAHLGFSVLILPFSKNMGPHITKNGYVFDPEPNYLLGLGKTEQSQGLLSVCLSQLDVHPAEWALIDPFHVGPQVITPETRLSLMSGQDLSREIGREYGSEVANRLGLAQALDFSEAEYQKFWENIPKALTVNLSDRKAFRPQTLAHLQSKLKKMAGEQSNFSRWLSSRKKVSDLVPESVSSDVSEVCAGMWYGITSNTNENPVAFDFLQALSLSRTGAAFRGGMTAYREFLINIARRSGAHLPLKTECKRIFVEGHKFAGVQVTGQGNMVAARAAIVGCSLAKVLAGTVYSGKTWFASHKKPLTPSGWKFTITLVVRREAVPSGLLPRSVWQETGAPVLEIEVVDPDRSNSFDSGHLLIHLRTVMPYTAESLDPEFQRLRAGRMTRQMIELSPFLDFHVRQIIPDFRKGVLPRGPFNMLRDFATEGSSSFPGESHQKDDKSHSKKLGSDFYVEHPSAEIEKDELKAFYGFESVSAIPDNLLTYAGDSSYNSIDHRPGGGLGQSLRKGLGQGIGSTTGIEGLRVASDEAYPHLGSLGSTLAAVESVAWFSHQAGLSGPFGS